MDVMVEVQVCTRSSNQADSSMTHSHHWAMGTSCHQSPHWSHHSAPTELGRTYCVFVLELEIGWSSSWTSDYPESITKLVDNTCSHNKGRLPVGFGGRLTTKESSQPRDLLSAMTYWEICALVIVMRPCLYDWVLSSKLWLMISGTAIAIYPITTM